MKEKDLGLVILILPLILMLGLTFFVQELFIEMGIGIIPMIVYAIGGTLWLRWSYTHLVVGTD